MRIEEHIQIAASRERVWRVIADIDGAAERIRGIESIQVLERPASGLVGLKWRETRTLFGKTASEVMRIIEAVENERYRALAESHGAKYRTDLILSKAQSGARLTMRFLGEPQGLWAQFMAAILGRLIRNSTRKMVRDDLKDIKAAVEQSA